MPLSIFDPEADSLVCHAQFPGHDPQAHRERNVFLSYFSLLQFPHFAPHSEDFRGRPGRFVETEGEDERRGWLDCSSGYK